jgi:hypothetical protein
MRQVFSFFVRHPTIPHKLLHWHFVASLLNDLFGIQARGGYGALLGVARRTW